MAKSAKQRLEENKQAKTVILEKDFAGVKKGQKLFVATPRLVADYICQIPYGETRNIIRMRRELARQHGCDASCPVSTAIFIRIAAQAAIDELSEGRTVSEVIPFWRLLQSSDKITGKLSIEAEWLDLQRELEKAAEI